MFGDIRGERIQTMADPQTLEGALFGALGDTLSGAAAIAGPVGFLAGAGLAGAVFMGGLKGIGALGKPALKAAKWAGIGGLAATAVAGFAGIRLGVGAAKVVGKTVSAVASHPKTALAIAGGAAAAPYLWEHRREAGVVFAGGLAAYSFVKGRNFLGTALAAGAGIGLGANIQNRREQLDEAREAFIASSSGYMARGAAGRSRNQGHY